MFLNITNQNCRYLTDHGHTHVGILLVSILDKTFEEENASESANVEGLSNSSAAHVWDELFAYAYKNVRSTKQRVLHEVMHKNLTLLALASACELLVLFFRNRLEISPYNCFLLLWYSCEKDVSGVKHVLTAFLYIRCLINNDDIFSLWKCKRRLKTKKKVAYNSLKEFLDMADASHRK